MICFGVLCLSIFYKGICRFFLYENYHTLQIL